MNLVKILNGTYRNKDVINQTFELVTDVKEGARGHFITVRPNAEVGQGWGEKIRINVRPEQVEYLNGVANNNGVAEVIPEETDEEIMERIGERFEILDEMTRATVTNDVRAMILTGPPGIGKSYGVIKQLEKANLFNDVKGLSPAFNVVKGATTGIGLYMTLFNHSDKNSVLVFDDCDDVFYDDITLNLLKAALDTNKTRKICWNSASKFLEQEGIPNTFNFKGSIIFITNLNFDNIRSKKLKDHLAALQSRCHYINLTINTPRDKFLRIKQIYKTGKLFEGYDITEEQGADIIDFIEENKDNVRELSLRLAIKAVELVKISPKRWRRMAAATLLVE